MFHFLPPLLKGILSLAGYTANTIILSVPLIILSTLKIVFPMHSFIVVIDKLLIGIATLWISINTVNCKLFCNINWDIRGLSQLEKKEWYLVISNHQSWVDILALQTVLNKKVPMLKFFLKKELIWVPFLGLAWWALDFPFMKRYSKKEIQANPKLKGKDIESTKKACQRFKHTPVSIMNFVEGTRFTPQKRVRLNSEFHHLLKPKAGGIAFVMGAMGDYLHKVINITIVYPDGIPNFWDYLSGKVNTIIVDIEVMPVTQTLMGDYFNAPTFKKDFFNWVNELWQAKDTKIQLIMKRGG